MSANHSCPKTISPQSRPSTIFRTYGINKERREINLIRIPERRILIKVFAVCPLCPDGNKILSALSVWFIIF
jgi:hypothetical protein